jgi:hypothetical protein
MPSFWDRTWKPPGRKDRLAISTGPGSSLGFESMRFLLVLPEVSANSDPLLK